MKASKALPDGYERVLTIDLSEDMRLMIGLNLLGVPLLLFAGWIFWRLAGWLRPDFQGALISLEYPGGLLALIAALVLVLVAHELVHGLFFWIYLRARPTFGLRTMYAYAAAPGWYIPRNQYLVIGLAPLVVLTALGLALLPRVNASLVPGLLVALTLNAGGAVGDLAVVLWLLGRSTDTLIEDEGDRFHVHEPSASGLPPTVSESH